MLDVRRWQLPVCALHAHSRVTAARLLLAPGLHASAGLRCTPARANVAAGVAFHSCTTPVCASGPCMPTVSLPHAPLQLAGAAAVGRTGRTGLVLGTRFAAPTPQDGHRVFLPPAAKCVQGVQDGSWARLSLQRIHCGTGELCSGRRLQNATEDLLIRVSWSVH